MKNGRKHSISESESELNSTKKLKHLTSYLIPMSQSYNECCGVTNDLDLYLKYYTDLPMEDLDIREKYTLDFLLNNGLKQRIQTSNMSIHENGTTLALLDGTLPLLNLNDLKDLHKILPETSFNTNLYIYVRRHAVLKNNKQCMYKLVIYTDKNNFNSHSIEYNVKDNSNPKTDTNKIHELAIPVNETSVPDQWFLLTKDSDYITRSYLWESQTAKHEVINLGKPDYTFFTLHGYAYYGFFKPSLFEVYRFLPIIPDKPFYVTTDMLTSDVNSLVIGNYQVGVSKIWIKKD